MKITILTICPEFFESFLQSHVVRRAHKTGAAEVQILDLKAFAEGSFRQVDDSPFGGGRGMVLRCTPVFRALEHLPDRSLTAVLTPAGRPYTQETAHRYAKTEHLVLICGHYEGIDERILSRADEAVSIGDYILTGGEIPAMAAADSVLRLLPGVLRAGSAEKESFENGLLEHPQYTQPAETCGMAVPEILLSGNHAAVERYRFAESVRITLERRPDLIAKRRFTEEERAVLREMLPGIDEKL